jgi:hypothetical protein
MARTKVRVTPDTRVVVQRTVTVSTEWSIADLAQLSGETVEDVVTSFNNGARQEWVRLYHVAEMVPEFDRASTADGDVLDIDSWAIVSVSQ